MFTCKIENPNGEVLELTQHEADYQIIKIDGLNPPKAQINRSTVAGLDGSKFNSAKLEERNIVLTIRLNGDVERNRLLLYTYFRTKDRCKFYYKNDSRDVYIEGYVETVEADYFSISEIMQISIICPYPFFKAAQEIVDDISKILAEFEFPFSINLSDPIPISTIDTTRITNVVNESETECGLIIEVDFLGSVSQLQLNNISTGEIFVLNYNFIDGDKVTIDTNKGSKNVKLLRNATTYNLFSHMTKTSSFFQLGLGDNYFSYLADDGYHDDLIHVVFRHYMIYRGV